MRSLDPETERAVRTYIARLPPDLPLEHAILYGSRARGNHRADSDADLALVLKDRAQEWLTLAALSDLAVDIFWDIGIFVQPVPFSSRDWADPDGLIADYAGDPVDRQKAEATMTQAKALVRETHLLLKRNSVRHEKSKSGTVAKVEKALQPMLRAGSIFLRTTDPLAPVTAAPRERRRDPVKHR